MMAALRATSETLGLEDGIISLLQDQSQEGVKKLATGLSSALGPKFAGYIPGPEAGSGKLALDLGALLALPPDQLDDVLVHAGQHLASSMDKKHTNHDTNATVDNNEDSSSSSREGQQVHDGVDGNNTSSTRRTVDVQQQPQLSPPEIDTSSLRMATENSNSSVDTMHVSVGFVGNTDNPYEVQGTGLSPNSTSNHQHRQLLQVVGVKTTDQLLRNGTISITARDDRFPRVRHFLDNLQSAKESAAARLTSILGKTVQIDWSGLQQRIRQQARSAIDKAINRLPRIKKASSLEQIFQILVERLTGGDGLGRGCTPYVFNGGGTRLPETIIFPSFSISQATGNCVLLPEFIGNGEYPGQWSLMNSRIACLGPAQEYLLVPAFYRSAATSAETFTCPTCRNEFTLGPEVVITLAGDSGAVVKYKNKAEFLAALKRNSTFIWGGNGLDGALAALKQQVLDRKEVLLRHLGEAGGDQFSGGPTGGLLAACLKWIEAAWQQLQPGGEDGVFEGPLGGLLSFTTSAGGSGGGGGGGQQQSRSLLSEDTISQQSHQIFTGSVNAKDHNQDLDTVRDVSVDSDVMSMGRVAGFDDADDVMQDLYHALIHDVDDDVQGHAACHDSYPSHSHGSVPTTSDAQPGADVKVHDEADWEVVT